MKYVFLAFAILYLLACYVHKSKGLDGKEYMPDIIGFFGFMILYYLSDISNTIGDI